MPDATVQADAELIVRGVVSYDTCDRAWFVDDMEAVTAVINGAEIALTPEQRKLIDVTAYAEDLISAAQEDAQQRAEDWADWQRDLRQEDRA